MRTDALGFEPQTLLGLAFRGLLEPPACFGLFVHPCCICEWLSVAWAESSEARVFPGCAATYYPCVQELPVPEQKLYTEDMAFGASTFPPQYLSSELALHPCSYSPYSMECAQSVCPVPGSQYAYSHPSGYRGFQTMKPRNEQMCPLPQDTKALFKKKTYEQKFDSKKADGSLSSDLKSVRGSHPMSIPADSNLKSDTDGYHKRTDRKSRIVEKSGSASKPEFEFTRLDFPELPGPENSKLSETQKPPKWGPLRSASADLSLLREVVKPTVVTAEGEGVVRSTDAVESMTGSSVADPSSCTRELSWTPMGYVVRQTLSTERSAAPKNVTSMINLKMVASSADPKSVSISPPEVLSSDLSYKERHVHPAKKSKASQGGDPEQNEASRKHKKKKEKSKSKYEVLTVQEPPRIEDAEEFPNLAVASERRDRVASPKFQSKQQPQNNFKNSGKKSQLPVQLDLGGMLAALEKKQHSQSSKPSSKPVVFSVGAVPVLSRDTASGKKGHHFSQVKTPHNPLDSSAPLMKKGKQREVPKAKKPTSLKKIILKERQERKQQRLQENAVSPAPASDAVPDGESGGDDEAFEQVDPSEGPEEVLSSAPAVESGSEEPPRAELQKEAEGCHLVPNGASCPKIHSRRFRDYCSQMLSKEVDACVTDLLKELVRFQDRMYQKDPVKAKTKRRLVLGLREVLKHLKLRKLKCIIISPNCEKIQSKGGLDDTLHTIIDYACEQNIPFVFALNRKALGRSLNKAVPVSVVGIFSYDGAQDQFHRMVELTMAARQAYKTMLENVRQELAGEPGTPALANPPMQGLGCSTQDSPPAPTAEKEEPHYIEIWRRHLEAYSRCALELEDSLEASTSQMMNLNL
ncbi:selenocysteine insertion sequence-binding protein 2 isoform X20 [Canis lupus familiaris]|uniref:selenocysteine insertion sequence-binding protein 2 isoform X20 n=1 Tax=Canis lupus familiaris TaxID=9615 RepID=UPI0006B3E6BF|nr:selenocysteine insertion sequence-binding protein 2 isoform X20 [Canis lupus familiaris]XP_038383245.1 selenocysteine insertion sequence-binding protein 2 isoform X12 [Canis lupus familiaris]|eukprot:XP_013973454.1 selenocysteine insertion sequence-binding protein 2 isoform X2 [Canis lupus familiaris]